MATLASAPPLVRDQALRQQLIDWFLTNAAAWDRQADGCLLWGATDAAAQHRANAAVCEAFARDLEHAALREPTEAHP